MTALSVEPQLLRAFVVTAREGSVSRAAEALHLTQPAISLQLRRLSDALDVQLFARTSRGVTITADGAALLPRAEKVLAAMGELRQAAQGLRQTLRGPLRIGTILDPEFTRLGALLHELVEQAPHVETELRQGMSGSVLAQVLSGELDVAFCLSPAGQTPLAGERSATPFALRSLIRFDYRVVAPAGWEARVRGADWQALAALPWLGTPAQSVHHRLLQTVLQPLQLAPRWVAMVDQEASMLDLVKAGVGLSLVRESIAIRESQAHGLALADQVRLGCDLQFVSLAARQAEPVIAVAWDAVRRAWRFEA